MLESMPFLSSDDFMERFVAAQSQMYGYIATLLPNRADADDLFQQTSLILWKKREQYDPARNFASWACGIAHNEVRNFLRQGSRRGAYLSDALMEKLADLRHSMADRVAVQLQQLAECMKKLSAEQRELLEQCYMDDQSIKAIAKQRQVEPGTLYKRLDRIRWSLMDCINADDTEVVP
jgi:RNA polymerase sigma-70 factor, ECF subfamily